MIAGFLGQVNRSDSMALPAGCTGNRACSRLVRLGMGVFLAIMAGCGTPGAYKLPDMPVPVKFKYALPRAENPGSGKVDPAAAPVDWWHDFANRELEGLIDRGLSNNPDMRIALNHIVQAKARADQAAAGKVPSVSANLVAAEQAPKGVTVGTAPVGGAAGGGAQTTYQAGIRSDWRLDLWGEQKALAESANFQLQKAVYERENVQRNLVASIASGYVQYLSLNDRLKSALDTEEILSSTLATVEKRLKAGDATLTEVEQQRAAIYAARATLPTLEQQRLDVIGALAFLVGTVPGNIALSDEGLDALTVPSTPSGLPSALLLRRPDLRIAEAQLLAADADLEVARARLLPPVDLSAQAGFSSLALSQLFLPGAFFWNVVDSATVSIFDRGRKKNDQIFSQSVQEEMVESYARTILQAMKEVESALSSVHQAGRRLSAEEQSVQAAHLAWDISTKVYAMGGVDYLTLLDTQRSYHQYLDGYQQTRMDYFNSFISLFQALAGGVAAHPVPANGSVPVKAQFLPPVEGIALNEGTDTSPDTFWQVELAGLYHFSSIAPAWRDLLNRYPRFMKGRVVRPRLNGDIAGDKQGRQSWHRLYVAKFGSPGAAEEFCLALQADQQRCRVTSSQSDLTVAPTPAATPGSKLALVRTTPLAVPPSAQAIPVRAQLPAQTKPPTSAQVANSPPSVKPADPAPPAAHASAPAKPAALAPPVSATTYTIQFGAFAVKQNATRVASILLSRRMPAYVAEIRQKPVLYAVRMGAYDSRVQGMAAIRGLSSHERTQARLVEASVYAPGNKFSTAAP